LVVEARINRNQAADAVRSLGEEREHALSLLVSSDEEDGEGEDSLALTQQGGNSPLQDLLQDLPATPAEREEARNRIFLGETHRSGLPAGALAGGQGVPEVPGCYEEEASYAGGDFEPEEEGVSGGDSSARLIDTRVNIGRSVMASPSPPGSPEHAMALPAVQNEAEAATAHQAAAAGTPGQAGDMELMDVWAELLALRQANGAHPQQFQQPELPEQQDQQQQQEEAGLSRTAPAGLLLPGPSSPLAAARSMVPASPPPAPVGDVSDAVSESPARTCQEDKAGTPPEAPVVAVALGSVGENHRAQRKRAPPSWVMEVSPAPICV